MLGIKITVETKGTAFENEAEEGQGSTPLLGLFDTSVYSESGVMRGQPTWHIRDITLRCIRQVVVGRMRSRIVVCFRCGVRFKARFQKS
jgi:hypothetical protein